MEWDKEKVLMKTGHDIQRRLVILYNKTIIKDNDRQ